MEIPTHVQRAIAQAKKDGHKGVRAIVGGIDEHNEIEKLKAEGKLETFWQDYKITDGQDSVSSCILLRKPQIK
jgi:hypothetical protein